MCDAECADRFENRRFLARICDQRVFECFHDAASPQCTERDRRASCVAGHAEAAVDALDAHRVAMALQEETRTLSREEIALRTLRRALLAQCKRNRTRELVAEPSHCCFDAVAFGQREIGSTAESCEPSEQCVRRRHADADHKQSRGEVHAVGEIENLPVLRDMSIGHEHHRAHPTCLHWRCARGFKSRQRIGTTSRIDRSEPRFRTAKVLTRHCCRRWAKAFDFAIERSQFERIILTEFIERSAHGLFRSIEWSAFHGSRAIEHEGRDASTLLIALALDRWIQNHQRAFAIGVCTHCRICCAGVETNHHIAAAGRVWRKSCDGFTRL